MYIYNNVCVYVRVCMCVRSSSNLFIFYISLFTLNYLFIYLFIVETEKSIKDYYYFILFVITRQYNRIIVIRLEIIIDSKQFYIYYFSAILLNYSWLFQRNKNNNQLYEKKKYYFSFLSPLPPFPKYYIPIARWNYFKITYRFILSW